MLHKYAIFHKILRGNFEFVLDVGHVVDSVVNGGGEGQGRAGSLLRKSYIILFVYCNSIIYLCSDIVRNFILCTYYAKISF